MSKTLHLKTCGEIHAEMEAPADKSISHRAVILAGLSNGTCRVRNFLPSEDCLKTLQAMVDLGVKVEWVKKNSSGPTELILYGRRMKLKAPAKPLDCGNSGTAMRLLTGVLAGQPFSATLKGDESLAKRPMNRVIIPLEAMGATVVPTGEQKGCAPLEITPSKNLEAIRYEMPVASAQVKSAILLAALYAKGKTTVVQPAETRDHTERLLARFRVRTVREGNEITIYGRQQPEAMDVDIPGDISSMAFWIVAAAAKPGSKLLVQNVGLNPTRTALLTVLIRMGAKIKDVIRTVDSSPEPAGLVEVFGSSLRGTEVRKDEVPNLMDEVPILAVAGALAQGTTVIRNAAELRVKESDRIATVAGNLRAMGAEVNEFEDGLEIHGGKRLRGATLDCFGDHRLAMAFAVAGLFADGETIIKNTECVATSYPNFGADLNKIRRGKNPLI